MKTIKQTIMAKNVQHVSHIKSKQIVNGKPKLPNASSLVEGEIAINFAKGVETISTKNESGNVITFSSDNYYTEQKLGSGFTDENSGRTVTEALDEKVNVTDVISAITPSNSGSTNPIATIVVAENEKVVSEALVDLDSRKLDVSAYTPTDLSNYYTKDETSGSTELADAFNSVNTSIEDLSGQSETVAVALNVLKDEKLDVTAYTPTDLSNYYTKDETSGATELTTAFNAKVPTSRRITAASGLTGGGTLSSNRTIGLAATGTSGTYTKVVTDVYGRVTSGSAQINEGDVTDLVSDLDNINDQISDLSAQSETVAAALVELNENKLDESSIINFFDSAKYENSGITKVINFYHGNDIKATIDASEFIKDGMIEKVELESKSGTTYLVITWNTDARKTVTELNIGDIFEADNYLTKAQLTAATNYTTVTKANSANTASTVALAGVTGANDLKAIEALSGTSGILKKTAANTWTLDTTVYSSATEVDTALATKVNSNDVVSAITPSNSGSTNPIATCVVVENEKVVSEVLIDINDQITDLSGQNETIATALNFLEEKKSDISHNHDNLYAKNTYSNIKIGDTILSASTSTSSVEFKTDTNGGLTISGTDETNIDTITFSLGDIDCGDYA